MDYDPASITQDEIAAFAERFNAGELRVIRNAAQDAMLADKGDVVVTSLGLGGTNGSGQVTGKPRYLIALAMAAIRHQESGGGAPLATHINFSTRRMET